MRAKKFPSRAMHLLSALLNHRGPLTLKEIRQTIDGYARPEESDEAVKKRLQRDRQLLQRAGIVIETEGGYQIASEQSFTRSLPLSDEERLALLFLEPQVSEDPVLAQAFTKINALVDWPEHLRAHARHHYRFDHPHTVDPTVRKCGEALAQSRCLEVSYLDASSQKSRRVIEPLHMAYTKGSWYCLAWCQKRQDYRNFNCYRMSDVKVTNTPIDPQREDAKDDAELFRRLGTPAFLYGHGEKLTVKLQVDAEVAFMIQDKNWPATWQEFEDGSLQGELETQDQASLFAALQPFFSYIKIEGPESFKNYCRQQFENLKSFL